MSRIKLPGKEKNKKIILIVLVIVAIGILSYEAWATITSKTIKSENKSQKDTDSTGNKISIGTVWLKKDSITIISKAVTTGLDDKTVVQVISGLQEGDEVITSYKKLLKKDAASAPKTKSPFMPTRGGGGRQH